ncbi:MAG: hypothetical protein V4671_21465 [Armatimonadota bacterium]
MLNKYCGTLKRVGGLGGGGVITNSSGGYVNVAHEISILEVGDTMLRKVRCTSDLFDLLDPGRDGCIYIFRHFFYKPILIGVKYDDGKKYTITVGQMIANVLSYLLIFPLLVLVSGFCIGMMGGKEGGFIAGLGVAWIAGGILLSWLQALLLFIAYLAMKAH